MYVFAAKVGCAGAHSFYGNANVARGFGGNHHRELESTLMAKNCSPWPAVERCEFSRSPVYRVMAGSW